MKRYLSNFVLFFIVNALPSLGMASTYYVAQNSAGSGDGITYANRMSIAIHNISYFSPGDTIYLKGAITSQLTIPSSGNAIGGYITYDGLESGDCDWIANSEVCTGAATITRTLNDGDAGIMSNGKDYIKIDDIEISNTGRCIMGVGDTDYMIVTDIFCHDTTKQALFFGDPSSMIASNITVGGSAGDGVVVKDSGDDTGGADVAFQRVDVATVSYSHLYAVSGTSAKGIDGIVFELSSTCLAEHNSVHGHNDPSATPGDPENNSLGEDGIDIKGSDGVIVRYNDVYDNVYQFGINTTTVNGINSTRLEIHNNRIWGNNGGIALIGVGAGNHFIYGNLIFNNGLIDRAFPDVGGIYSDSTVNAGATIYVYNNTLVNNGRVGNNLGYNIFSSDSATFIYKNNILSDSRQAKQARFYSTAGRTIDNNLYYYTGGSFSLEWGSGVTYTGIASVQTNTGQEIKGMETDPFFTLPASDDYTLGSGSPAIDSGADLGAAYNTAISPTGTDWSTTPPIVETGNQYDYGSSPYWEIGVYLYIPGTPEALIPHPFTCTADSEEIVGEMAPATYACDGNNSTFWHTQWYGASPAHPHYLQIDFGSTYTVTALKYLPRQDEVNGRIADYEIYISDNPAAWGTAVATGTFTSSYSEQTITFASAKDGRYAKLVAISEVNANPWASAGEVNLVGTATADPAVLTLACSDSTLSETGPDSGQCEITCTGSGCTSVGAQTVLAISGTAVNGTDYTKSGGGAVATSYTISAEGDTNIPIIVIADGISEPLAETIGLSLVAGTGYTIGSPSTVELTIPANGVDPPDAGEAAPTFVGVSQGDMPSLFTPADVPQSEMDALVRLFYGTNGFNWTNKSGWCTSTTIATWYGITVSGGHITQINLNTNNLVGTINWTNFFTQLPYLTQLRLYSNALLGSFTGAAFPSVMTYFECGGNLNQFTGAIPTFPTVMTFFSCGGNLNQFTGAIPTFPSVMTFFSCGGSLNQFTGAIPTFPTVMTFFSCGGNLNQFTGAIPAFPSVMTYFECGGDLNQFAGTIPTFPSVMTFFSCWGNLDQFTGAIPAFPSVMTYFSCRGNLNQFTGAIPAFPSVMTYFACWGNLNQFAGTIPSVTGVSFDSTTGFRAYASGTVGLLTGWTASTVSSTFKHIDIRYHRLTEAAVNQLLQDFDAAGTSNGTGNISGGTSAAPTGAGITALNNMVARGWVWTTN